MSTIVISAGGDRCPWGANVPVSHVGTGRRLISRLLFLPSPPRANCVVTLSDQLYRRTYRHFTCQMSARVGIKRCVFNLQLDVAPVLQSPCIVYRQSIYRHSD